VFFDLAHAARVQSLLDPALFAPAASRLSLSRSVSFIAGPGLALLADAASFAVSAALATAMRAPEPESGPTRTGLWREIREGISFTFVQPSFWIGVLGAPLAASLALLFTRVRTYDVRV
jgi:hypothetical protein